MLGYYKSGDQIDYANTGSAILAGAVVSVGDLLGIAVNDIAATTGVGPVQIRGIVKVTKIGSQAWTQGAAVYYDSGNTRFTTVASGNTFAGFAALAVGSGATLTTGYVLLKGTVPTSTTLQLTSPNIVTSIDDANGNELLKLTATASAVNEITLANAATGNGPTLTASGETNVPITLAGKGTGAVILGQATSEGVKLAADQPILDSAGLELIKFSTTAAAVNEITIQNQSTGVAPVITSSGEANIGLDIAPSGSGVLRLKSKVALGTSNAATLSFFGTTGATQAANIVALGLEAATQATTTEIRAISVAVDALLAAVKSYRQIATA